MNILKVGWIVFFVLLIGGGSSGYYLYRQQTLKMLKHITNKEEIEKLKQGQQEEISWKLEEERDIETLKNLAKKHDKWWFLHDIEEQLGRKFKPLFKSVGQMKVDEERDYLYISRKLEVEASYPELIRLLENLERERGFSIEKLKISSSSNSKQHQLSFILSTVEIKKGFLDELLDVEGKERVLIPPTESLLLPPTWRKKQMLMLKTHKVDPFVKLDADKPRGVPKGPVILPPIDLSSKYRLEGIIDFPQYRVAIIGPDYILKEGDWLNNMQIVRIDSRKVSLKAGKQEYFLAIPGFAATEDEIIIKETPKKSAEQQPEQAP